MNARRSGDNWFIGCMNSGKTRVFDVPLDFLKAGVNHIAYVYTDDPNVQIRTHMAIERRTVSAHTVLKIKMSAKGGMAVRISMAGENSLN
ncbi:glycoside hydrolase family 97 C-terminal domain-containing protein [candidate division KSB1 bacterium]|nr:glycoside hydrolase family 97 C-terminal domain-containing protein [candidate division KSB1 bacterium]